MSTKTRFFIIIAIVALAMLVLVATALASAEVSAVSSVNWNRVPMEISSVNWNVLPDGAFAQSVNWN